MMKTFTLSVFILLLNFLSANVSAQLTKGSTWLGGSVGYSSDNSESQYNEKRKMHSFAFNPAIGKVVKQNLIVGIELNYLYYDDLQSGAKTHNYDYGGGVFVRKYIETFKKIYLFVHAGAGVSISHDKTDNTIDPDYETKGWRAMVTLYPGISYALTSKIYLEAVFTNLFSMAYSNGKTTGTNNTEYKNSSFSAGASFDVATNFGLGVRFVLPNKSNK